MKAVGTPSQGCRAAGTAEAGLRPQGMLQAPIVDGRDQGQGGGIGCQGNANPRKHWQCHQRR